MSNTKLENQAAYHHEHAPKGVVTFLTYPAQLNTMVFDGDGSLGIYPDGLVTNPNTVFAIKCQSGMFYNSWRDGIYV